MIYSVERGETVYDQGGCRGVRLYEAERNEYVHLSIDPGGGVSEHSLPLAVSFCVLEGRGRCRVAGRDYEVSAGEMVECPPNELRGWINDSSGKLEILAIKRVAGSAG